MPAPKDPTKREEWLRKISRKGDTPWNKGKTTPEPVRRKQSNARLKFYRTEAGEDFLRLQALQASEHHKGVPLSESHKKRISESNSGKSRGLGHKTGHNTRQKIADTLKSWYGTEDGKVKRADMSAMAVAQLQNNNIGMFGYGRSGHYQSSKAGSVHYRSSWELEVFKQLDSISDVYTYEVEKLAIPYEWNGVTKSYIPDILIHFTNGDHLLVEIKPSDLVNDPQNQAKFLAAQAIYGDRFEVWSEELIFNIPGE